MQREVKMDSQRGAKTPETYEVVQIGGLCGSPRAHLAFSRSTGALVGVYWDVDFDDGVEFSLTVHFYRDANTPVPYVDFRQTWRAIARGVVCGDRIIRSVDLGTAVARLTLEVTQ